MKTESSLEVFERWAETTACPEHAAGIVQFNVRNVPVVQHHFCVIPRAGLDAYMEHLRSAVGKPPPLVHNPEAVLPVPNFIVYARTDDYDAPNVRACLATPKEIPKILCKIYEYVVSEHTSSAAEHTTMALLSYARARHRRHDVFYPCVSLPRMDSYHERPWDISTVNARTEEDGPRTLHVYRRYVSGINTARASGYAEVHPEHDDTRIEVGTRLR